jgi:hypothetical protein
MKKHSIIWATLENLICLIIGGLIGSLFGWEILSVIILVIISIALIAEGWGNE